LKGRIIRITPEAKARIRESSLKKFSSEELKDLEEISKQIQKRLT